MSTIEDADQLTLNYAEVPAGSGVPSVITSVL